MLVSKSSDFVKSYDHKDTSETNVSKLVEHLNSLSVKERRENLLFLLDQDLDVASNKKWLYLYKEDLNYIWKENRKEYAKLKNTSLSALIENYLQKIRRM